MFINENIFWTSGILEEWRYTAVLTRFEFNVFYFEVSGFRCLYISQDEDSYSWKKYNTRVTAVMATWRLILTQKVRFPETTLKSNVCVKLH